MLSITTAKRHQSPPKGPQPRARSSYRKPDSPRQSFSKEHGMSKPKPIIFAVAVTVATLAPAATANAGVILNHNETLLLDA